MMENTDLPREPADKLREQVLLLREIKQAMLDLQQAQTKTNEELSLLTTAMQTRSDRSRVKISNVDIPVGSLIVFMLKWALASVPVLIIIGLVGTALGGLVWYVLRVMGYV